MKKFLTLSIIALVLSSCFSAKGLSNKNAGDDLNTSTEKSAVKLNHQPWTNLLQTHVNNKGLVDYKGFQKDREKLDDYVDYLSSQTPDKTWSIQEQLAFYINAYNAFTVQLVLDNYPVESIKDIGGSIKGPFLQKNFMIGGEKFSLAGIEKGILTPMNEPRMHFAINCASMSCPNLMNEAYTADKIDKQLDQAVKGFVNSDKNKISKDNPKVSSIFKWYKKAFTENGETVIEFINQYSRTKIDKGTELQYLDYDWSLNEAK